MDSEIAAHLDRQQGLIVGLQAAVRALIACHPRPEAAAQAVQQELERFVASGLQSSLPDELIEAIRGSENLLLPDS